MDQYALLSSQIDLGIKKREDRPGLEIKGLVTTLVRPIQFGSLTGHVELWSKWCSEALCLERVRTMPVRKVRWLRKFDTTGAQLREIAVGEDELPRGSGEPLPGRGCNLELTEVTVDGRQPRWWTLGFEAFGPIDSVAASLQRTVEHVSAADSPLIAGAEELSYPAWIRRLHS